MDIATLAISIVAVVFAGIGLVLTALSSAEARRSRAAAEKSAEAAAQSVALQAQGLHEARRPQIALDADGETGVYGLVFTLTLDRPLDEMTVEPSRQPDGLVLDDRNAIAQVRCNQMGGWKPTSTGMRREDVPPGPHRFGAMPPGRKHFRGEHFFVKVRCVDGGDEWTLALRSPDIADPRGPQIY